MTPMEEIIGMLCLVGGSNLMLIALISAFQQPEHDNQYYNKCIDTLFVYKILFGVGVPLFTLYFMLEGILHSGEALLILVGLILLLYCERISGSTDNGLINDSKFLREKLSYKIESYEGRKAMKEIGTGFMLLWVLWLPCSLLAVPITLGMQHG